MFVCVWTSCLKTPSETSVRFVEFIVDVCHNKPVYFTELAVQKDLATILHVSLDLSLDYVTTTFYSSPISSFNDNRVCFVEFVVTLCHDNTYIVGFVKFR